MGALEKRYEIILYGSNMNDSNNNDEITGDPENNSVYYSAASSSSSNSDDSAQQQQFAEEEQVVVEEVNFEGRREHQQEYRRRLTLDPLTDFIVNGNMLLEEVGSDDDAISSEDEPHQNNNQVAANQQQSINNNLERDDAADRSVREQLLLLLGHEMIDNDSNSSSSDDDVAYIQQNQNNDNINNTDVDVTRLLARDHAYLPTAQPLYPEEWIAVSSRKRSHRLSGSFDVDESNTEQSFKREVGTESKNEIWNEAETPTHYEIAEPPGANNPKPTTQRTTHSSLEDIGEQSAAKSVLAIMEVGDVVLFPGSVIPLRVRDPVWVNYVGALIDDARGLYGSHSGSAGGMGEVQIGILPRISRRRTRRRSSSTSVANRSSQTGGRMGRWRIDLIRRGVASIRRPGRRRRDGTSTNNNESEAGSDQNDARNRDNDRDEESEEESSEDEYFHPARSAPTPSNPFIGRIGTMATITFTHEEAATSANIDDPEEREGSTSQHERSHSRVWQRHRGEIVVSALGTKRFRIIAPVNADANHTCQDRRYNGILFEVEVMSERLSMPPSWMLRMPGDFRYPIVTQSNSHANAIWNLSLRSSLPVVVYQSIWPWRVAQKICNLIQQTEQYQGIKEILSSAGGIVELGDPFHGTSTSTQTFRVVDPSAFADWLSSNLPLSQNERLDLLEMGCRASQLKYLLKKIEKDRETVLRCKYCAVALSPMRHVFTVKGAEGTTGHYVNEVCLLCV